MNIKSTQSAFGFFLHVFTCWVHCHVFVPPKRHRGLGGGGQFLPFIIKRILGIKHIFPCSFGNKHMRLLTRVYGI